jgi:alpha-L-fucosidase
MIDGDKNTYWATNDGINSATITLLWDEPQNIHYVELMEYIAKGQRVKKFYVEVSTDGSTWTRRAPGVETTTVGYKRIIPLNGSTSNSYDMGMNAKGVRITIEDSKACLLLSKVGVY